MSRIVPFTCSECGASFHELDGGICRICNRLLCRRHLRGGKDGPVCRQCAKPPDVSKAAEPRR